MGTVQLDGIAFSRLNCELTLYFILWACIFLKVNRMGSQIVILV